MNRKPKNKPQVRQPKTIVYARCERTRKGIGARIGDIYMTTYSTQQWEAKPVCPNCGAAMVAIRAGKMPL